MKYGDAIRWRHVPDGTVRTGIFVRESSLDTVLPNIIIAIQDGKTYTVAVHKRNLITEEAQDDRRRERRQS